MKYRRAWIPGGSYFFTVVTQGRRPVLTSESAIEVLRQSFREVRSSRPFQLDAMVVLPEHLHCIWTLPPGDSDFATRWRLIKTWFTKHCDPALRGEVSGYAALTRPTATAVRIAKCEQALWQHRYWEHALRDEADCARHVDYIHYNPVKHGLVSSVREWPYSSFQRFVEAGLYPPDWGQSAMNFEGVGHE